MIASLQEQDTLCQPGRAPLHFPSLFVIGCVWCWRLGCSQMGRPAPPVTLSGLP